MKQIYLLSLTALFFTLSSGTCKKEDTKPEPSNPSNPVTPTDTTIGKTGTVSFTYRGQPVTYATVKAKDGRIWLQQNLGASRVATKTDDIAAYGDIFQWGRWDDGHQLRITTHEKNTLPTPNNPSGLTANTALFYKDWWTINGNINNEWTAAIPAEVTANKGCDPCKALGAGWRMPTADEWKTLLDKENINSISAAFSSNLKIAGAGHGRSGISGSFDGPGLATLWSSTTSGNINGTGDACAKAVNIRNTDAEIGIYYRYDAALSVRCILAE